MTPLDDIDRRLIEALRENARASITTLAGTLGCARATVQTRLDNLQRRGVIRRFTIELGDFAAEERIHAIMMIRHAADREDSVMRQIPKIRGVVDLHKTNGKWDLVARLETHNLPDFDRIMRDVRRIDGVTDTETCLLLDRA